MEKAIIVMFRQNIAFTRTVAILTAYGYWDHISGISDHTLKIKLVKATIVVMQCSFTNLCEVYSKYHSDEVEAMHNLKGLLHNYTVFCCSLTFSISNDPSLQQPAEYQASNLQLISMGVWKSTGSCDPAQLVDLLNIIATAS
ncbi:hypothetical protein M422DRAFT_245998 [Sphaerobolus stellatus SS14]|nr:hypothetical protein M422DRAFT_245998 [Sphaerobolus stellatus SS14]